MLLGFIQRVWYKCTFKYHTTHAHTRCDGRLQLSECPTATSLSFFHSTSDSHANEILFSHLTFFQSWLFLFVSYSVKRMAAFLFACSFQLVNRQVLKRISVLCTSLYTQPFFSKAKETLVAVIRDLSMQSKNDAKSLPLLAGIMKAPEIACLFIVMSDVLCQGMCTLAFNLTLLSICSCSVCFLAPNPSNNSSNTKNPKCEKKIGKKVFQLQYISVIINSEPGF